MLALHILDPMTHCCRSSVIIIYMELCYGNGNSDMLNSCAEGDTCMHKALAC